MGGGRGDGLIWEQFGIGLGIDLGSVWHRLGVDLGLVWDEFGVDLRVGLGSAWGRFNIGLGSIRCRSGVFGID